ncbi:hypothetical protein [Serpentinicella alkaliphila]|nr:hypothetical protein [Serpentinicella alkaliphila]QUH25718.1 hypothetical protein HZR23_08195 [Serpentinicella alkaliphila]
MNYNEFMKSVDEKLSSMSEMEKAEWIHNMARTINENQRIIFLNSLTKKQEYCPDISIKKEIKELEEWCRKIEDAEIYFQCTGYEEYGEGYWGRDYTYEYSDIFEIGKELSRAFQIAEDLLSQKEYQQAAALYDVLCSITFATLDSEIEEWSELGLEELVEEKLVILDLKSIALNMMYAKYQVTEGEERAAALYRHLSWDMCKNIKAEEMFTVGPEELKGIDRFMEDWISFLKNIDGDLAGDLLTEACIYQGGITRLCEEAREAWARHPILYKHVCKHLLHDNKEFECIKLGMEAIKVLPEKLIIRGNIANLVAKVAVQLNDTDIINQCYEAAFYSESNLYHYLRLFELSNYLNIADRAVKYAQTLPENSMWEGYHKNKQMMVNSISKEHKMLLRFFNGEFDYIYEECKKDRTTLGWSSSFKGTVVPLFILLLDKNNKITKAGQRLIDGIEYKMGFTGDYRQSFTDQFLYWKEKVILRSEQYEKYIGWLKEEIEKRTESVVGGSHRKSYYKVAALITALGETLESNGKLHGRMVTIEHYKKMHPKKRAFKTEFGQLNEE